MTNIIFNGGGIMTKERANYRHMLAESLKRIARRINQLGEKSYATPAVAGGKMYLRTFSHLLSIGKK